MVEVAKGSENWMSWVFYFLWVYMSMVSVSVATDLIFRRSELFNSQYLSVYSSHLLLVQIQILIFVSAVVIVAATCIIRQMTMLDFVKFWLVLGGVMASLLQAKWSFDTSALAASDAFWLLIASLSAYSPVIFLMLIGWRLVFNWK